MAFFLPALTGAEYVLGKVVAGNKLLSGVELYLVQTSALYDWYGVDPPQINRIGTTGKDGAFRFDLPSDVRKSSQRPGPTLVAWARGCAPGGVYLAQTDRINNIRVNLEKETAISGVIRDRSGKPVSGAEVRILLARPADYRDSFWDNRLLPEKMKAITGKNGRYRIPNLPPESTLRLAVIAPGYALLYREKVISGQKDVDFRLTPEGRVEGRVTFQSGGSPAAGVSVCLTSDQIVGMRKFQTAQTDSQGRYRISNVPPGRHTVSFLPDSGFPEWVANDVILVEVNEGKTATGVDLQLIKGGIITGIVIEKETRKPIDGVSVSAAEASRIPSRTETDTDGKFSLRVAPSNRVYVSPYNMREEYCFAYQDTMFPVHDGDSVRGIVFSYERGITRTGKVLSPEGKPLAGVSITPDSYGRNMAWSGRAVSDSTGVFTLRGVRKGGAVHLAARQESLHLNGKAAFQPNEEIELRLTWYETTEVRGKVLDEERRPVSRAFVRLGYIGRENESIQESFSAITDASGVYRISGVQPAKDYGITVEASGYRYRSLKLPVSGANILPEIVLLRTDRWITGTVVDPGGNPVEGATVEVTIGCCREVVEGRTNEKGYFRLDGLMHLIEPLVTIRHPKSGYGSYWFVPTNASRRFIIEKMLPRRGNGDPQFDEEKVQKTWALLEGKPSPLLNVSRWLNGKPMTLNELRGKLVVLHFWSVSSQKSIESLREAENLFRLFG
ncbi:MAG: carboxypeptidase regulatory-like domain-containing protein, partial [Candidatus Latescibacterota bacterium]